MPFLKKDFFALYQNWEWHKEAAGLCVSEAAFLIQPGQAFAAETAQSEPPGLSLVKHL